MYYVIILIVIAASIAVLIYNNLIANRNNVTEKYEKLEDILLKRYELLPHLIEIIQPHFEDKASLLSKILEKHKKRVSKKLNTKPKTKQILDSEIETEITPIIQAAEENTDLKDNKSFKKICSNWKTINKQIISAKKTYNEAVEKHNLSFEKMPGKLFAGMMSYIPENKIEW